MIAIRLQSRSGKPPGILAEAVFGAEGGTIGRAPDNTLVLADDQCHISRRHFQVACRDGRYFVRLTSANLLVTLDGRPLVPGVEHRLEPGATITVGPYALQVRQVGEDDPSLQSLKLPEPGRGQGLFDELLPHTAPTELDLVVGEPTGARKRAPREGATDVLAALFAGLGVPPPDAAAPAGLAAAERIGALLRAFVTGALTLIESHAAAKGDLGLQSMRSNRDAVNPLKMATDEGAALSLLLAPESRGFMRATTAVQSLFEEWRTHEEALRAGMRAALAAALDRLDPAALELEMTEGGLFEHVVPANRKARLWERYVERHAALAREAQQEFDAAMAGAFIRAFEDWQRRQAADAPLPERRR